MKTNILAIADALSDQDLLARIPVLAGREYEAAAELVGHLAALDARPKLYVAKGYASLFTYCTQALRLSEDVACNRIDVARACRRFPVILDLLAAGSVSLTSVRLLAKHLTAENHRQVLARASGRNRHAIEALVAELAPQPDIPASVRKLHGQAGLARNARRSGDQHALRTGPGDRSFAGGVRPDAPSGRAGLGAGALPSAIHYRRGDPREAPACSGAPPPRDPGR